MHNYRSRWQDVFPQVARREAWKRTGGKGCCAAIVVVRGRVAGVAGIEGQKGWSQSAVAGTSHSAESCHAGATSSLPPRSRPTHRDIAKVVSSRSSGGNMSAAECLTPIRRVSIWRVNRWFPP